MSGIPILEAPQRWFDEPPRSSTGGPILVTFGWPDEPYDVAYLGDSHVEKHEIIRALAWHNEHKNSGGGHVDRN